FPEHLTAGGLVEANVPRIDVTDRFEHAGHAQAGELACQHRLLPACGHETLGRQVVDLVRPALLEDLDERRLIEQVGLVDLDAAEQMADAVEVVGAGPAENTVDLIPLGEEELREIAAVLPRDAGDDRPFHSSSLKDGPRPSLARAHGDAGKPAH